jgi:hypothetical protein
MNFSEADRFEVQTIWHNPTNEVVKVDIHGGPRWGRYVIKPKETRAIPSYLDREVIDQAGTALVRRGEQVATIKAP